MRSLTIGRAGIVAALVTTVSVVAAACGGSEAIPTRAPSTPSPSPPATAAPTASPTLAPAPTPTPPPATVPTPVTAPQAQKRGGTLQLTALPNYPVRWDTFEAAGWVDMHILAPMMNNLIWLDPYGKGLVGDTVQKWEISQDGLTISFFLQKGIKFHDGTPFTSKDVAYNFDRGMKPRTPTMNYFQGRLAALDKVETPDDYTVRLVLKTPSNILFRSLGMMPFLMYPASMPFPEKYADWKSKPIGTGPFKFKGNEPNVKTEFVRNEAYWKTGLPYVDGIVITNLNYATLGVAALRSGRVDATNFEAPPPQDVAIFQRDQRFIPKKTNISTNIIGFNQKAPFTDPRVREAVHLAVDRAAVLTTWLGGHGSAYAAPLLPPEIGGQFGIPVAEMKTRPGWRDDRSADIARAKQLIAEAGLDRAALSFDLLVSSGLTYAQNFGETVEANLRSVGFNPTLFVLPTTELNGRTNRGDFAVLLKSMSLSFDDPKDYLESHVVSRGFQNQGKWAYPRIDEIMVEQDRTLDVTKRRALLREMQDIILQERTQAIPLVVRFGFHGYFPWTKNFPTNADYLFDSVYRWEQVWLDR